MLKRNVRILLVMFVTFAFSSIWVISQDERVPSSSGLLLAVRCDPDNPQLINLAEDGEFLGYEDSNEVDGALVGSVIFRNEGGQTFQFSVTALQPDIIEAYLDGIAICAEVLEIDEPQGRDQASGVNADSLQFFKEVIFSENLGIGPDEIESVRRELVESGVVTLPDMIETLGGDLDYAYQLVDEFGLDRETFEARGMPLLLASGAFPTSDGDYTDILQRDPMSVVVSIEALDYANEFSQSDFAAYLAFYIDPTYHFGSEYSHYYRAKCTRSAYVGVKASNGGVGTAFWRYSPYGYIDSLYSSGGYDAAYSSVGSYMTHDVRVDRYGVVGTTYAIYGGWYKGWGGNCG
ncbi:hypothetical protein KC957_03530 [Candidatus Saccharibacteria bacterium]|nr:hypothetical protein [Candidatus Saccharibacteria bacterium]